MPKLTFLGAAGCVTGSKFLVEANGKRLLVDAGLFQGNKALRLRNWESLPVDPATIDAVVLTHAHIDHTGYLPRLIHDGYRGPIYANAATRDLCTVLLPDSARLQEEDAERAAFKGYSNYKTPLPLYTEEEAQQALQQFRLIPAGKDCEISPVFSVRLSGAGHILGSSSIHLTVSENGRAKTILFSGDIGRYAQPILHDPENPPAADYLLCESTYGDREHPTGDPHQALVDALTRVTRRGGSLVIPAFAVGRTQTLLYVLRQLEDWQRIPSLPVYVDSPMAIHVTQFYLRHRAEHDREFLRDAKNGDALSTRQLRVTRSVEQSKHINRVTDPCVIISASGMATGGRVLHHLARRLPDSRNAVLLAGFQAEGSRGRNLLEGAKTLRIHGDDVPVKAEIVHLNQFSAHAGKSELLRWLAAIPAPPKRTFLVHGEPSGSTALRDAIQTQLGWSGVSVARYQEAVEL